jgi:hypothetical protein
VNLQILMDKEQTILRKNILLALEGRNEKNDKISNDIDRRVDSYYVLHASGVPHTLTRKKCQLLDAPCVIITA